MTSVKMPTQRQNAIDYGTHISIRQMQNDESQHFVYVLRRIQCAMYSTFTEYEFAIWLLRSAKVNFGKRNMNTMFNLIIAIDFKTSCFIA